MSRDETVKALSFMADVGKTPYNMLQNAIWGDDEQDILSFSDVLALQKELASVQNGAINWNEENAYKLIKSYVTLLSDADLLGKAIRQNVVAPAILESVSRSDGRVVFEPNNNVTLTWMLDLIPVILKATGKMIDFGIEATEAAAGTAAAAAAAQPATGAAAGAVTGQATTLAVDQITNALVNVVNYANTLIKPAVAELVYPYAQRLGLVGPKLTSGNYLLFQAKAADNYFVNPLAYTLHLSWADPEDLYVTVADLGILTPYFAEGLYEYARNTTVADSVDRTFSRLSGRETTLFSDLFGGKQDVTAVAISYSASLAYYVLGGERSYLSEQQLANILTFFLYKQGRTAQNVLMYFDRIAEQSKMVFTGYVDDNWSFYNLDRNVTLTATKVTAQVSQTIGNILISGLRS